MINHDVEREKRTGVPEVVLAEPKSDIELLNAINAAIEGNETVLVTRIKVKQLELFSELEKEHTIIFDEYKRTAIINPNSGFPTEKRKSNNFAVAILSAGTSDRYIVEEIRLTLEFFGWSSHTFVDIGVAGIHRSKEALDFIKSSKLPKFVVLIVVAGQDGAIFPVITGQTALPVIAVPSPIGYGYGGKGKAALYSALQSCAPGLAVVNIENGFGAAALASKILTQINKYSKFLK